MLHNLVSTAVDDITCGNMKILALHHTALKNEKAVSLWTCRAGQTCIGSIIEWTIFKLWKCDWMLVTSVHSIIAELGTWGVDVFHTKTYPANTTCWNNGVLMLGQRRRRWANIKTLLFQRVVFCWVAHYYISTMYLPQYFIQVFDQSTLYLYLLLNKWATSRKYNTLDQCWFNTGPSVVKCFVLRLSQCYISVTYVDSAFSRHWLHVYYVTVR